MINYSAVLVDLYEHRNNLNKAILSLRCVIGEVSPIHGDISHFQNKWIARAEIDGCECVVAYGDTKEDVYALVNPRRNFYQNAYIEFNGQLRPATLGNPSLK